MSTAVLDRIREERDQARAAALAIAEGDNFNPDDTTFTDLQTRAEELDRRAGALAGIIEKQAAADAFDGRIAKATKAGARTPDALASPGELFTRSDAYSGYSFRGTSGRFYLPESQLNTRALPTGVADLIAAGYKGAPTRVDSTPPTAPTPLLDNVATINVSTNAIEYVGWFKKAGGAAKVAEKAAKPSAEFGPQVTATTLDTIAVYTQLTRQLIEDEPAARSAIDNLLQYDVLRAEEAEAVAALAAAAAVIPDVTNADLASSIRLAQATVQSAGYNPTAFTINPADWAAMDIKMMAGTLGGPTVQASYWGMTPIPSLSQAVGTATVGDFRVGISHYVRSGVALYITDSHADTFLSNVFTLLAERRSKTVVVRPSALAEAKTA